MPQGVRVRAPFPALNLLGLRAGSNQGGVGEAFPPRFWGDSDPAAGGGAPEGRSPYGEERSDDVRAPFPALNLLGLLVGS